MPLSAFQGYASPWFSLHREEGRDMNWTKRRDGVRSNLGYFPDLVLQLLVLLFTPIWEPGRIPPASGTLLSSRERAKTIIGRFLHHSCHFHHHGGCPEVAVAAQEWPLLSTISASILSAPCWLALNWGGVLVGARPEPLPSRSLSSCAMGGLEQGSVNR